MIKDLNIPENMTHIFKDGICYLNKENAAEINYIYSQLCELDKNEENKPLISGLTLSEIYWLKVAVEMRIPVNKKAYEQAIREAKNTIETFSDKISEPKSFQIQFNDGTIDKIKTNIYPNIFRDGFITEEMIELAGHYSKGGIVEIKFELETISGTTCPPTNIIAEALVEATNSVTSTKEISIKNFAERIRDSIQSRMIEDGCLRRMIISINGEKIGYKGY